MHTHDGDPPASITAPVQLCGSKPPGFCSGTTSHRRTTVVASRRCHNEMPRSYPRPFQTLRIPSGTAQFRYKEPGVRCWAWGPEEELLGCNCDCVAKRLISLDSRRVEAMQADNMSYAAQCRHCQTT